MANAEFSTFTTDFGSREHTFKLDWAGATEWEELRNKSLFQTYNSMVHERGGNVGDVREVIRLALIGGGLDPIKALSDVRRYVEGRPLEESLMLAIGIMEAFIFGADEYRSSREAGTEAPGPDEHAARV